MATPFQNPFARKPKAGYPEALAQIKSCTRELLGLHEDVSISITELNCRDRDCPDVETVIAVLIAGAKPRLARVHKAIVDVTSSDLADAFKSGPCVPLRLP